jgi:hypothetical protein
VDRPKQPKRRAMAGSMMPPQRTFYDLVRRRAALLIRSHTRRYPD